MFQTIPLYPYEETFVRATPMQTLTGETINEADVLHFLGCRMLEAVRVYVLWPTAEYQPNVGNYEYKSEVAMGSFPAGTPVFGFGPRTDIEPRRMVMWTDEEGALVEDAKVNPMATVLYQQNMLMQGQLASAQKCVIHGRALLVTDDKVRLI